MDLENQNIFFSRLLQSLENDFDPQERIRILEKLKNSTPTDEALVGAKMVLEANNWDYTILKQAFQKTESRIEKIACTTKKDKTAVKYLKHAAVLIPVGFVLGYFINFALIQKPSIDQFYSKDEGLPLYMGTRKTNFENLMVLYRDNNMKAAFEMSEDILAIQPQNDTAIYFHAVIGYELKNFKVAKADFIKITQKKESAFYYDAVYRLGFTLKKLKEEKAAYQQFSTISKDQNNPYNKKATEILECFD
ncbi:tetratricopeptide repeat protein [Flavobacterium sp.]|uniref:tetratricopeptide repeat protein n=1 Tax=Flavobacterium sp. TaxID=239 RepID=UPI00404883F1